MEGEEELAAAVEQVIRRQLGGEWDDGVMVTARFKAFSGQRSDWEPLYLFWRDLIINTARQLGLFIIKPSQVKNIWFRRGGLTPLCLDHVLLEMYKAGDVLCISDLVDPKSGRLALIVNKVVHLLNFSTSTPVNFTEDHLIISLLLSEKAFEVVKVLSDSHWTSSCIITMSKFQEICGGTKEASAILSHLSGCGKVKYLAMNKNNLIEGVKVSLSSKAVSTTTSLDYNILHLTWTAEKLQQQLNVIYQRYDKSKKLALASLKSGNKIIALRHAREIKFTSQSREKCTKLLNRVEEVLRVIADADDTKEVSEALQIGARAMKDNNITAEEVQLCLEELDESMNSQKQVEEALGSTGLYAGIEDEDIKDELEKLELEIRKESSQVLSSKVPVGNLVKETEVVETAESLSNALSNLQLAGNAAMGPQMQDRGRPMNNYKVPRDCQHEAA